MKLFKLLLTLSFLLFYGIISSQNLVSPFIKVFPKEAYGYGTQNWEILQSTDGLMLFANNDGLVTFNGYEWDLYPLSNRTILRAILENDGKVYAGGQNELGYYQRDLVNNWKFTSLKAKIPLEHQDFEDVWNIVEQEQTLFFRSSGKIFVLENEAFKIWDQKDYVFLGKAGGKIFLHSSDGHLLQVENGAPQIILQAEVLKNIEIRSIVPFQDGYLIASLRQGFFTLKSGQLKPWELPRLSIQQPFAISKVDVLPSGELAIATNYNGLILWKSDNEMPNLITSSNDLTSDGVISTCIDNSGNLWLGLENGIAMVELSTPIKKVNLVSQGYGVAYDLVRWQNHLYIGTNSGLYKVPWPSALAANNLKLIPGSQGQVWGLQVIDDRLFMSHANGLLEINDGIAKPVFEAESGWLIKAYDQTSLMFGTYEGVYLGLRQTQTTFLPIEKLQESSRFLEVDPEGDIWMSHPYRGVFRIQNPGKDTEQVRFLGKEHGLPSSLHNHVFKINNQVIIAAEKGLFYFDKKAGIFKPLNDLNQYFDTQEKIRRLKEAPNGNIWFITESEIGYLKITEVGLQKNIEKRILPNVKRFMNGGWEKIYPIDDNNVFITSINGLLYIQLEDGQVVHQAFPLRMNTIQINQDSTFYPLASDSKLQFSPKQNDLTFEMSAIDFAFSDDIRYEYFLEGFDEGWTTPDHSRTKEYTNLPYQKYTLKVRAMNPNQRYSEIFSLDFEILKPWYLSLIAKVIYGILAILLATFLTRVVLKRFEALENEMANTVNQSKKEIRRLESERIQAELDHKKRELVSTTIHIAKKNETIQELAGQLNTLKREIKDPIANKKLQKVIHFLKTEDHADEGWDQLLYHFNELHPSFFDKLKKEHQSLTPKDLKLCAYLKMNLSTKEIANLMNVSIRGIEASRYRLRKRLNLPSDSNLNTFFMNY